MPTYDYLCDACGHQFEEFQSITAPLLTKCPQCKKKKLKRLFGTGAAVVFKGSGFYQTDYRSEGYKKAVAAESGSNSGGDGGGKSGDSTSSKPESAASAPASDAKKSASGKGKASKSGPASE
jgi:putative FmdB family regulatory protein